MRVPTSLRSIRRRPEPIKGAIAGLLAGLAGSWAMDAFQGAMTRVRDLVRPAPPSTAEPATVRAASALARRLAHRDLTPSQKEVAGPVMHYAMGAVSGAAYGLAAELAPGATRGRGLGFGSALWLGADEATVPLLRLSGAPTRYPIHAHVAALAAHAVYGLTTDLVRRMVLAFL